MIPWWPRLISLVVVGAILDGKHYVRLLEYSRLLALTAMLYAGFAADLISITGLYYAVAYLLISAGLTWVCVSQRQLQR